MQWPNGFLVFCEVLIKPLRISNGCVEEDLVKAKQLRVLVLLSRRIFRGVASTS